MEKFPNDQCYISLCTQLGAVADLDSTILQTWLGNLLTPRRVGTEPGEESQQGMEERMKENRLLLRSITSYLVKDTTPLGEKVAQAILNALVLLGSQLLSPTSEGVGFTEIMVVMATLAGAGTGVGHLTLVQESIKWLELW